MISLADFKAAQDRAASRKVKRTAKGIALGFRKKKTRGVADRKKAFDLLKSSCREYVLLRANRRNFGFCEVGVACRGYGAIEVWYHIFPQQLGNGTKYDDRAILGSCCKCNEGEMEARRSKSLVYEQRHKVILGSWYEVLSSLAGRRQISTAEAYEIAGKYRFLLDSKVFLSPQLKPLL